MNKQADEYTIVTRIVHGVEMEVKLYPPQTKEASDLYWEIEELDKLFGTGDELEEFWTDYE